MIIFSNQLKLSLLFACQLIMFKFEVKVKVKLKLIHDVTDLGGELEREKIQVSNKLWIVIVSNSYLTQLLSVQILYFNLV